ncbi:hypothetical protein BKA70DRAFT_1557345 [Coprinopsis sp. MPI-PUGE-AT-0042]|nr:hypothetical protein BKA70DRAFT_1557345 [Coprinopsis sp. MPI-PUGE-AT-0042]
MPPRTSKRLYLKGLDTDVSLKQLRQYMSSYGEVREVKFVRDYAFVEFKSAEDASNVHNIYCRAPLFGKEITIQYARPLRKDVAAIEKEIMRSTTLRRSFSSHGSSTSSRSSSRYPVVVVGLPEDLRWQELKDFGRSSGCLVAFCDLDVRDTRKGFVEYFTKEDAEHAIKTLDGAKLKNCTVRVIDYAEISKERKLGIYPDSSAMVPLGDSVRMNCPHAMLPARANTSSSTVTWEGSYPPVNRPLSPTRVSAPGPSFFEHVPPTQPPFSSMGPTSSIALRQDGYNPWHPSIRPYPIEEWARSQPTLSAQPQPLSRILAVEPCTVPSSEARRYHESFNPLHERSHQPRETPFWDAYGPFGSPLLGRAMRPFAASLTDPAQGPRSNVEECHYYCDDNEASCARALHHPFPTSDVRFTPQHHPHPTLPAAL